MRKSLLCLILAVAVMVVKGHVGSYPNAFSNGVKTTLVNGRQLTGTAR